MPQDRDDPSPAASPPAPTAAGFDQVFSAAATSPGVRRAWQLAEPNLPPQIEPFSFVSADLLRYVLQALDLSPEQTLVDLGCGRGGPGLWLAQQAGAALVGVDFSPVGVSQATSRAALFGLADQARFVVGDLAVPGFPTPAPMPPSPSTRSTSQPIRPRPPVRYCGSSDRAGGWC